MSSVVTGAEYFPAQNRWLVQRDFLSKALFRMVLLNQLSYISVVVPFYNVESCVADCLASLLAQTFTEYEVVCVNDGSTDDTGVMLDMLAQGHKRVRVVHIDHAGLSVARNAGVVVARGNFVTFVDGDDVISPWYLETLVWAQRESGSKFVKGRAIAGTHEEIISRKWEPLRKDARIYTFSRDELFLKLFEERLGWAAWGCLAPRELYLQRPFIPDIFYEDAEATPHHYEKAGGIAIVELPIYGYVIHEDSISHSQHTVEAHIIGCILAAEGMETLGREWPEDLRRFLPLHSARMLSGAVGQAQRMYDRHEGAAWTRYAQALLLKALPGALLAWREIGCPSKPAVRVLMALLAAPTYVIVRHAWSTMQHLFKFYCSAGGTS